MKLAPIVAPVTADTLPAPKAVDGSVAAPVRVQIAPVPGATV